MCGCVRVCRGPVRGVAARWPCPIPLQEGHLAATRVRLGAGSDAGPGLQCQDHRHGHAPALRPRPRPLRRLRVRRHASAAAAAAACDLPAISLGLWHNFGDDRPLETQRAILRRAFDRGVTHFDLANNYGPPYGSAEANFGTHLRAGLPPYRDELVISTKAGYDMWPGPYGRAAGRASTCSPAWTSRSRGWAWTTSTSSTATGSTPTRRSRRRWGRSTRPCAPGKALYAGISSYGPDRTREAAAILRELGTPLLIHQPSYSMLNRWIEEELLDVAGRARRRLHRVLPAGPGHADRASTSTGSPRARGRRARASLSPDLLTEQNLEPRPRAERDRGGARPVAGADGAGLGAARPAGDLGAHRGQQRRPARRQPRRAGQPRASTTPSWPGSTSTPSTPGSTCGRGPGRRERGREPSSAFTDARAASVAVTDAPATSVALRSRVVEDARDRKGRADGERERGRADGDRAAGRRRAGRLRVRRAARPLRAPAGVPAGRGRRHLDRRDHRRGARRREGRPDHRTRRPVAPQAHRDGADRSDRAARPVDRSLAAASATRACTSCRPGCSPCPGC